MSSAGAMDGEAETLPAADAFLVERASVIRALGKRVARDIIEIGRLLAECKEHVGHGGWSPWLEREFGWSERTALNFMQVHRMMLTKSAKVADLNIDASALYLLARPSTANDIREDVLERAEAGQAITHNEVARLIDEARAKDQAASAEELERRIEAERNKAAEREREIRAEYDNKLVIDADELAGEIARHNKPLHNQIAKLERQLERQQQAEERRKSGMPPKIDADISLRATTLESAIETLCESLTITPAQVVQIELATADVTGQTLMDRLGQCVEHAELTVSWIQQFLTEYEKATQQ